MMVVPRPSSSYRHTPLPFSGQDPDVDPLISPRSNPYVAHFASASEKKRLWWRTALVNGMFIGAWFFFSILLSMYNKWMFSPEHFGFPYPFFVTTLHFVVQFCLSALLRNLMPQRFRPDSRPTRKDWAYVRYSMEQLVSLNVIFRKKIVPTGVATSLDIGLGNVSLKLITLSFYTMVKSSSLIFVLFFAFLLKLERFSLRLVGVILLIVCGVVLMVATETHFEVLGFFLVLTASAMGGLRWGLTQILLKNRTMGLDNPSATIFWLAPVMAVTLGIISGGVERWWRVFNTRFFDSVRSSLVTTGYLVAPGALAFCMVLSEFYIIQRAGVVPMSIAGIAKEVTTISVSAWFFHDELTPLNIVGVGITVCGIALYTYHKYRKSMESTVPLDAHGNPIEIEDENPDGQVELGETERLRLVNDDPAHDFQGMDAQSMRDEQRTLFEVGDDDEPEEFQSVTLSKLGYLRQSRADTAESAREDLVHDSMTAQDAWRHA
ncbi:TPT-domain-containing protein [Punctularia strigosozonata HHB-11173 SS5]|uniref:TPT-domain-containing protein n=1 Tax=Punctularia strigosozonata (strain HHB-11173) TaxID=741275 RepID=UPI0004416605|nr:TPT-domain-containing protein [Punctularia strigosozonata HHB-11173 SS5]EIN12087.1 TPT-domain-containing protein [Punctularia strigosozonata HHB-11173 SS5]